MLELYSMGMVFKFFKFDYLIYFVSCVLAIHLSKHCANCTVRSFTWKCWISFLSRSCPRPRNLEEEGCSMKSSMLIGPFTSGDSGTVITEVLLLPGVPSGVRGPVVLGVPTLLKKTLKVEFKLWYNKECSPESSIFINTLKPLYKKHQRDQNYGKF